MLADDVSEEDAVVKFVGDAVLVFVKLLVIIVALAELLGGV